MTDRRILVTEAGAVRLDIAIESLRRFQFDIETPRRAAMVIVPTARATSGRASRSRATSSTSPQRSSPSSANACPDAGRVR
jgi:hypothetical protein